MISQIISIEKRSNGNTGIHIEANTCTGSRSLLLDAQHVLNTLDRIAEIESAPVSEHRSRYDISY